MAMDQFLELDGIKGESTDKVHKEKIDVLAWSFSGSNSGSAHQGGGAGSGKSSFSDLSITKSDGVGYGDSYIVDPHGEIVVRSRRHVEDFIFADIDPVVDRSWGVGRTMWSAREFGEQLMALARKQTK